MSLTRRPGSGRPLQTSHREDRHMVRNARVQPTSSWAAIQAQVAPSLGTPVSSQTIRRRLVEGHLGSFNLSSDDRHVRVRRPRSERLNPAFSLQRHTAPTTGVMVWGVIACNKRSPLVLIRDAKSALWYVLGIFQPHVFPLMQWLPGAIFQQDNAGLHTARVSQDCLYSVTTCLWPD
ncbi:transposable element Tcb2 transposase [Trichonephila clavipes]|nr:transposable element Tcb2 transposase [Trichonephila clavipes]